MLGECGLDRFTDTSIDQQMPCFIDQLVLAEKYNKPAKKSGVSDFFGILTFAANSFEIIPRIIFQITPILVLLLVYYY